MGRKLAWLGLAVVVLLVVLSSVAQAAEAVKKSDAELRYFGIVAASARLAWPLPRSAGLLSARGIRSALEGIARNPGASGPITTTMIIGLALIESLVIYVLVVCLILLIVNPFASRFHRPNDGPEPNSRQRYAPQGTASSRVSPLRWRLCSSQELRCRGGCAKRAMPLARGLPLSLVGQRA